MAKTGRAANGKIAKKHKYKNTELSIKDFSELPECIFSRRAVTHKIKRGMTMDQIASVKERYIGQGISKTQQDKKAKKPKKKKVVDIALERRKAIMAVPVNVEKTQEHYMKKSHIRTPDVEPTVLNGRNWMGRP